MQGYLRTQLVDGQLGMLSELMNLQGQTFPLQFKKELGLPQSGINDCHFKNNNLRKNNYEKFSHSIGDYFYSILFSR